MNAYLHGIDVLAGLHSETADETEVVAQTVLREIAAVSAPPYPRATALGKTLPSQIPGVSDEAWTEFALGMKTTAQDAVSSSNAFGMFEMRPRRLEDLGLMRNVVPVNSRKKGAMAWIGEWVPPLTEKRFLGSAIEQYDAFGRSMRSYLEGLDQGVVPQPDTGLPADMTVSGALAILHRCGPSGLVKWIDEETRLPNTVALYQAVNGIF